MVAVAVTALAMGIAVIAWRRSLLQRLAAHHDTEARSIRPSVNGDFMPFGVTIQVSPEAAALADYHERLAEKYREAARHPWLPVEPDPPEPQ
jgi:hypothetical protein